MKNHVLYFNKPCEISVIEENIPSPKIDEVLVKNMISGISAGTEMLFYQGLIPDELNLDDTIPSLNHKLNYPFKYGYCSVGKVIEVGDKKLNYLLDHLVFVFNPHESYFCVKTEQVVLLPQYLAPHDALFLANMETAINLLLDGSPLIGENVLILGLGVVGLLTTCLLRQFPLTTLIGADLFAKRRDTCEQLGARFTLDATHNDVHGELRNYLSQLNHNSIDLIYELTGNPEALNSAISFVGYEGRIVLGSWYGKKPCHIDLGGKFHRSRIKVIASQVSTLASELQGRWTKDRRFEVAFDMLKKIKPSKFISHNFHITQADQAYKLLQSTPGESLQVTLSYDG